VIQRRLATPSGTVPQIVPAAGPLVWADEFGGPAGSALDDRYWEYNTGQNGFGNGENQAYLPGTSNCVMDGNSCLVITCKNEAPPIAYDDPAHRGEAAFAYTSAQPRTRGKLSFSPTSGGTSGIRIQSRIRLPVSQGLHAGLWTTGAANNGFLWPDNGEIDIIEFPSHLFDATYVMNLHGPTAGNSHADKNVAAPQVRNPRSFKSDFRLFGIDWYLDRLIWHLDNRVTGVVTQAQYEAAGGDWVRGFTNPHFLILQVAVGGNWPGEPDGTTVLPAAMLVDWLRVYAL
jgi:beta-glucanase (GH16 family)